MTATLRTDRTISSATRRVRAGFPLSTAIDCPHHPHFRLRGRGRGEGDTNPPPRSILPPQNTHAFTARSFLTACLLTALLAHPALAAEGERPVPLGEIELDSLRPKVERLHTDCVSAANHPLVTVCQTALSAATPDAMQRRLDKAVGIVIEINPESRVKVEVRLPRLDLLSPASATASNTARNHVLVKVINYCGATAPLSVFAAEDGAKVPTTHWSFATPPAADKPKAASASSGAWRLTGDGVDYLLLNVDGPPTGSREVKLRFDVGAGTQDIGFRGEGSVLVRGIARAD